MHTRYLFSSDSGDLPLGPDDLERPFLLSPQESHTFLTLGDYFRAIEDFLLERNGDALTAAVSLEAGVSLGLDDLREMDIRSEKHGAFYHISSVEVPTRSGTFKFGVSAALSETGRRFLKRETGTLARLGGFRRAYTPRLYAHGQVRCRAARGEAAFSMMLTQWLTDYHEWHLSMEDQETQRIRIWDTTRGARFGTERERFETFKQAASILTYYYDARSYEQIRLWHHAAGDFVIKTSDGGTDVRLTTVRDYRPLEFLSNAPPATAAVFFFLHLAARMRLDKADGLGKTMWARGFSVEAAVEGFFEALVALEVEGRCPKGLRTDLPAVLRSFEEKEFLALYGPLLELYRTEDPEGLSLIEARLPQHVRTLRRALSSFCPRGPESPS